MPENIKPQRKELREFGYMMAAVLSMLFGLLLPYLFNYREGEYSWVVYGFSGPLWPFIIALIFFISALIHPVSLGPIYTLWMKVGHVLGWINTRIILGVVFYVLVFPIGLVLKLFGKDPLKRKLISTDLSYRVKSERPEKNQIERPY